MSSFRSKLMATIILLIGIFATGCGTEASTEDTKEEDTFKVGFVYRTSSTKSSYDNSHEQARKYLEAQLPNVETEVWKTSALNMPTMLFIN